MNIAILNDYFLKPEHIERLKTLGTVSVFSDTDSEEKAIERLKDIDIAIADCYIAPLTKKVLESTKTLKLIALDVTGYDLVDLETANKKGIKVANLPTFATEAVAEHAIALIFAVIRKINLADASMRENPFQLDPADKDMEKFLGFNLEGKTLGVIGLGRIGQQVAHIGNALGMNVLGYDINQKNIEGIKQVTKEELLKESDIVSINLLFIPELENFISKIELDMMKPTAIIINTARGKLINEKDLHEALSSGKLAGAGLDVIVDWSENNPLTKLENVVLTPHMAFFTKESIDNMATMVIENVKSFIEDTPTNIVN